MSIYISKISEVALSNKYTNWYISIIETAIARIDTTKTKHNQRKQAKELIGSVEGHHILPKCMCVSEDQVKDKHNFAYLTPREHLIVHMLLTNMFSGDDKKKMAWAAHRMINKCANSTEYNFIRNTHAKLMSERKFTDEERNDMSDRTRKQWDGNDERRKHASLLFSKFRKDGTVKTKTDFSDDDREMFSNLAKANWDGNDERRKKTSEKSTQFHLENPDFSRNIMNRLHSEGVITKACELYWTDENKQARSAQTKSFWDNVDWKEKQLIKRKERLINKETVLYALFDMIVIEFKTISEAREFIIAPRTGTFSKLLKITESGGEFTHKGVLFYKP